MNLVRMQYEIMRKLDTLDLRIDIKSSEISSIINEELYKFIDKYYALYEDDEKARKALSLLTKNATITSFTSTSSIIPNSVQATLPADLLYTTLELATISGSVTNVKPITLDTYKRNVSNPFKKPYNKMVWRLELRYDPPLSGSQKAHTLISDGTITNYTIGYIKTPTRYTIEDNPTSEIQIPEIYQWDLIDDVVENIKTIKLLKQEV